MFKKQHFTRLIRYVIVKCIDKRNGSELIRVHTIIHFSCNTIFYGVDFYNKFYSHAIARADLLL